MVKICLLAFMLILSCHAPLTETLLQIKQGLPMTIASQQWDPPLHMRMKHYLGMAWGIC